MRVTRPGRAPVARAAVRRSSRGEELERIVPGRRFPARFPPGCGSSTRATTATPATSSARATCASPASTPTAARSPSRRSGRATSSASWRCSTARLARPASRRSSDSELLALPAADVRAPARRAPGDLGEAGRRADAAAARGQRARRAPVVPDRPEPRRRACSRQLIAEEAGGARGASGVTIRMTQADLAQLAGTSRESVSRFLADARARRGGPGRAAAGSPWSSRGGCAPTSSDEARPSRGRVRRAARARWSSASFAGAGSATSGCWRRWRRSRASCSSRSATARRAYADSALPIGHGQTISQPWIVAAICEALALDGPRAGARDRHGLRVLGRRAGAARATR